MKPDEAIAYALEKNRQWPDMSGHCHKLSPAIC